MSIDDSQIDEALENLRTLIQGRVRHEQLRDQLTLLPNATALHEALDERLNDPSNWWVAFVEVDRFKSINDRFGYENADRLLKLVSGALREMSECFPGKASPFRMHGDEFYLVGSVTNATESLPLAIERLLDLTREKIRAIEIEIEGRGTMSCTVSVGWLLRGDITDATELAVLGCLDRAMSEAKLERDCVRRFVPTSGHASVISLRGDCQACRCKFAMDVKRTENLADRPLRCPNCGVAVARPPVPVSETTGAEPLERI